MANQKLKTLRVMEILLDYTDENHILNATQIIEKLEQLYDISADRKSIYTDIDTLKDYGVEIEQTKGTNSGYYVAGRDFDLAELKLLVDAVQSSKLLTEKKSNELIKKLEKLTSSHNAKQLQRQVFTYNRVKTENETILYNIDNLHEAINSNKQIKFKYYDWDKTGKLVPRKEGAYYVVSPWALTWDDENYYMVGYDEATDKIRNYRVDKMKQISVLEDDRLGAKLFKDFDLAEHAKKTFGMFRGDEVKVTFICKNEAVGVAIDRFGKSISLRPEDEKNMHFSATVMVSPQFFGWLTGVGDIIKIKGPENVKSEYLNYLKEIMGEYK